MIPVRQSTARTFMVGPVLDADGVAVTDGVIADFKVSKNGGAPAAFDGSATLTHRHTGHYSLAATANDLDTVGCAQVTLDDTVNACAPVALIVVEEVVYDALFAASAPGYLQPTTAGRTLTVEADGMAHADVKEWLGVAPLALSSQQVQAIVPNTQKVDVETIKTNPVVNAGTVTFPTGATLASTTNITAGTITTVTNLTNAPTSGDLTATMKTSVQTAAEAGLVTHRLDELLNADSDIDGAAPPTVGSVFHELMTKTAGSFTFDQTTDSLEAIRDRGDAAWITATGFSTHSAADVWAVGTRILTAGTNIVLAKGTGVTGFNDLSAAQVNAEVDTALIDIHLDHLIAVADPGSVVADSSFLAKLVSKSATPAFSSYANTTDSLEAIRDNVGTNGAALSNVSANVVQVDSSALSTHSTGYFPADVRHYGGTGGTFSAGRPEVNTTHIRGSASVGAAGYMGIDWASITAPTTTQNLSGTTIGTLTTNADKTGYSLSGTQTFNLTGNITGNLSGSVGSVTAAVTITGDAATAGTRFLTMIELDTSVYRYTTNALEQAPGGGGGALSAEQNDWLEATYLKTQLLGANTTITFSAPFMDDDGIIRGIIQGDDLKAVDGRAVTVSIPLAVADLTGATDAKMKIQIKNAAGLWTGSVDSIAYTISGAGTEDQAINFDFDADDTLDLFHEDDVGDVTEDMLSGELRLVDVQMTLSSGNIATRQFTADVKRQVT